MLAAGTASCESYSTNSARYPPDEKGEVILNVTGTRYLDRFECRGGAWRIVERRNQSVWSLNGPELPTPPPPFQAGSPALRRARCRNPPQRPPERARRPSESASRIPTRAT